MPSGARAAGADARSGPRCTEAPAGSYLSTISCSMSSGFWPVAAIVALAASRGPLTTTTIRSSARSAAAAVTTSAVGECRDAARRGHRHPFPDVGVELGAELPREA